jgi:hypothetical protein
MLDPKTWNEELLKQYSADMRQFVGAREYTLNGQRALHLYNAVGLEFIVLPDRGFDIWDARYKGIPLTWIAPGSPHPPDWGAGWLRGFNGGLLTTCGPTHVGPAETDDLTGERSDIHGNFTRLRAENYHTVQWWNGIQEGGRRDNFALELNAELNDAAFFGTQLSIFRKYSLYHDMPSLNIHDVIINMGDTPAPLMLLYHFNLGYPLVREGTKLYASGRTYARDAAARAGLDTWDTYDAPSAGYAEQVFYHHLRRDFAGHAEVLIGTDALALHLQWEAASLPCFTQWKNTRQRQYVNGIEPGNCVPEGRNAARKAGRLQMLAPGETVETYLCLTVLDAPAEIANRRAAIESLNIHGDFNPGCDLSAYGLPKE